MHNGKNVIVLLLLPIFSQASDKVSRKAAWDYLKASGEVAIVSQKLDKNMAALSAFYKNQEAEISANRDKLKKELFHKMIDAVLSTYQSKELTEITQFLNSRSGQIWMARNRDYRIKFDASTEEVMSAFTEKINKNSQKILPVKASADPTPGTSQALEMIETDENK